MLDRLTRDEGLEKTLREMLQSLIKLRKSNWGHSPPSSLAGSGLDSLPGAATFSLEPNLYAPDGEVLTMEEINFLQDLGFSEDDG